MNVASSSPRFRMLLEINEPSAYFFKAIDKVCSAALLVKKIRIWMELSKN